MNKNRMLILIGLSFVLLLPIPLFAQSYNSGSTGTDGTFSPTADITLALPSSGIFNFTTVTVPTGVTVTFTPNIANTPVTILATGDVLIDGVMSVNGENGHGPIGGALVNPGGAGGPGGFPGGHGGVPGATSSGSPGHGPGGGGGFVHQYTCLSRNIKTRFCAFSNHRAFKFSECSDHCTISASVNSRSLLIEN